MTKKVVALCLAFLMLFCVACTAATQAEVSPTAGEAVGESLVKKGDLLLFNSGLEMTQDQVLSRIRADKIIQNGGYEDNDEVIVLLTLSGDALIDTYQSYAARFGSVSAYAASDLGKRQAETIDDRQNNLIYTLAREGLIESVEHTYNTILNAVAVKAKYRNLVALQNHAEVAELVLCDTYNLPQTAEDQAVVNLVDVYETGIFDSSTVSYTGKGTSVAVLDSGFDCSHSVFARQPDVATDRLALNRDKLRELLPQTNAKKFSPELSLYDVFVSNKIPYVYDYADKDANVNPYDSEHGTHVSGIIGGSDEVITGVAVDTQLVLMKVFRDYDEGAETDDILAALEDAVLLGVDAINMSLGSSCGFVREQDEDAINRVYDKINESGVSLICAASNSYSAAFGGENGNTNKVTNPDSGTVGSPSTYKAALSVASISGVKSKYLVVNGEDVIFFLESNAINGLPNDFYKELGITEGVGRTYEYVTIPGVGLRVNYTGLDVNGKIVLVRRGDTTFEEKAAVAKSMGAAACIIYNNVEGDINMSMGKSDHIPTVSISKENGTKMAAKASGTIELAYTQQAGPFMNDFSSWGPTPDLSLKPEITAHGGTIKSAVPGYSLDEEGNKIYRYDELSGTSMACPNMCGIVVLVRQYLKEKFPDKSDVEIKNLTNQLLMSTATIALNEEGNPYSPRKQGAGLASLYKAVNTKAVLTVKGLDRTKLELGDDPDRTGVYTMTFVVNNFEAQPVAYDLSLVGMTESVSTSDKDYVAEKARMLSGDIAVSIDGAGSYDAGVLSVDAAGSAEVTVVYTLSADDKAYIEQSFPYGMYVEGYVTLSAKADEDVDLNVPFLAFYGDWCEAPIFDKTYYEVETEAHNAAIDPEDKIKADYYATTPYGVYYYNYMIPLGTYLYTVDESAYDPIPAVEEHIAVSNILGTLNGIAAVYAGLLRNAKTMSYTITDKLSGELVWEHVDYNGRKAFSNGGTPIPYYDYFRFYTSGEKGDYGYMVNNRQYEFRMEAALDYGDGGQSVNKRNSFGFDFTLDNEAPVIKSATYETRYDKTLKKNRYYITLTVYDNHYVQSVSPIIFTSASGYTQLTDNPIPVYSERGADNTVTFEITDYLQDIEFDALLGSALGFSVDDYALNTNIYMCQLPGTKGDFSFTRDGTAEGTKMMTLTATEGDVVDLTRYLATTDASLDEGKAYLKYLEWASSNERVATVKEGLLYCVKKGTTTITVSENLDLKTAKLMVSVRAKASTAAAGDVENAVVGSTDDQSLKSVRFSYFDTVFAYARAAEYSEIGETGDRRFLSAMPNLSLYPGESIRLHYDIDPWYAADKYNVKFASTNEDIAYVAEDGTVTAKKKGSATITLTVDGSTLMARVRLTVKSEFIIENRTLVSYKGLGGTVEIPDDEGILYIGAFAFCLYDTDYSIEITDDDYDKNKIPAANTTVTKVIIPKGVTEIQNYAFYNCSGLKEVVLSDDVKFIRNYAFYGDESLDTIDLNKVEAVGMYAFYGCTALEQINLATVYAIGQSAFEDCTALKSVDLTALRNVGRRAFQNTAAMTSVKMNGDTKLSYAMFARSGLTSVDIYTDTYIPDFCFARCASLASVTIHGDIETVGYGAFSDCDLLSSVRFLGEVESLGEQSFLHCHALQRIELPDCEVALANYAFYHCESLATVAFGANTRVSAITGSVFEGTALASFEVDEANPYYATDGSLLTNKEGDTVILAAVAADFGDYTLPAQIRVVGDGAFAGTHLTALTIGNSDVVVGDYAFANCADLARITLPSEGLGGVGKHAFNYAAALTEIVNLDKVAMVGDYAFANSALTAVVTAADAVYGEGVFFQSKLQEATLGARSTYGVGAFQNCSYLVTVNMPEEGGVHFGVAAFGYDSALTTIDLSKVDDVIENQTFYGCSALRAANLQGVKQVGDYAFADCAALNVVAVPVVERLGEGAFARYDENGGAPIFAAIELPDTLVEMGDGVFLGCAGISEITLPASLDQVSDYTFAYCVNLTTVRLPDSVRRIGRYAFAGCEALNTINTQWVEAFDDFAFTSAAALRTASLQSALTVGEGAFASTSLGGTVAAPVLQEVSTYAFQNAAFVAFEAPNLVRIGSAAFENCANLASFTFASNLQKVGILAFEGCKKLANFAFAEGEDVVVGNYAMLHDGSLYTKMANGHWQLTAVPGGKEMDKLVVMEGTYRIETYAGNTNEHVSYIELPDSLKYIGNYAFYGYKNLKTVEFKSYTAPVLENSYNADAALTKTDPGYALLHNQYDVTGWDLCYFNFVDLLGKSEPLGLVLPANSSVEGYDNLVYEVYFGRVSSATRSQYVAQERSMVEFYTYATKIASLKQVILDDETLINNALAAYNAIEQDPADYGYDMQEWQALVDAAFAAKNTVWALKMANASQKVRDVQARIDALPDEFSVTDLPALMALAEDIQALLPADRSLLNQSKMAALSEGYDAYRAALGAELAPYKAMVDDAFAAVAAAVAALGIGVAMALKMLGI